MLPLGCQAENTRRGQNRVIGIAQEPYGHRTKRYSQMKLQMKREALDKINRQANEMSLNSGTAIVQ